MSALDILRNDPETACKSYSFTVDGGSMNANPTGGACTVSCEKINDQVYKLVVKAGGIDFFFPYMNATTGGVGECTVPVGQRDGTLALTGSMNGCALQVNRNGNSFIFYHDSNGSSLAARGNVPGAQVCRVEYKSYAGPLLIGEKKAADLTSDKVKTYFQHCILSVHNGGKWKVYVTGIHTLTPVNNPGKAQLVPFTPHLVSCMTSFEDA